MTVSKKQKAIIIVFIVIAMLLLIAVGGFYMIKTLYPLKYEDKINENSESFGIDKYLVCAVVDTESGFNPSAVSSAGAVGLMQLMPDTGKWVAGKLGDEFTEDSLKNADTNIRWGTWYLSYLYKRYNGDVVLTASAYNAGHSKADEWLSKLGENGTIDPEKIPYDETRKYVKKIKTAYEIYEKIYPDF